MKINYLFKLFPLLSTLALIILLCASNQKVNTKLRILIWNTPELSLGSYLAISTGAGFILSVILNTKLGQLSNTNSNKFLEYKSDNDNLESNQTQFKNYNESSDKIFIERDIQDPSPTLNAQFRVIGKSQRGSTNYINTDKQYVDLDDREDPYVEEIKSNVLFKDENEISSDWFDESFTSW